MNALDSLSSKISGSEFNEIALSLDRVSEPAILITENRQAIFFNHSARSFFEDIDQEYCSNYLLPETTIWDRVWARVKEGHPVTTSTCIARDPKLGSYNHKRVDLILSLLSGANQLFAMCVFPRMNFLSIDTANDNLGKFPEENPNPVMRLSSDGKLLYANRASNPLLKHWNKTIKEGADDGGFTAFNGAVESGKSGRVDINCGDRVYSVAFAPVAGSDYLNVYALDTTEKKGQNRL